MFELSAVQIVIVLIVALLVFGPKRLPELGRQFGKGMRELKGQMSNITDTFTGDEDPAPWQPAAHATAAPPASGAEPAAGVDDDLLDGVVVSGSTPPPDQPGPGG